MLVVTIAVCISFTRFAGRLGSGRTTGTFLSLIGLPILIYSAVGEYNEEIAALKISDPHAYLAKKKDQLSRSDWLKEAQTLAPELYEVELKSDQAEAKVASQKKALALADDKKFARHCVSRWDGAVSNLKKAVVASLRDPDSFDHINTVVGALDREGFNQVAIEYPAKNGFGGLNVERIIVKMRNADCAISEHIM